MKIKKSILLVEDESAVRSVLFRKLSQLEYNVVTAGSFLEAQTFIQSGLKIDLAILDIKLPDGDGLNLIDLVKKPNPQAECIIVTGFGTIELAMNAARQGVFQFITKPFELTKFLSVVERALNHKKLVEENRELKKKIQESHFYSNKIIGKSPALGRTLDLAKRVSDSDSTVLISGESGTGKELIAKLIHEHSNRSQGPFVAVNCGALSDDLLESELFGHKKGSFTGAIADRKGKFCRANNGTLFLDEVGDMSPRLQVKLLRALQEKTYEAVGGQASIKSNTRIIAATHKNLESLVSKGSFREDLFYRLNVIPLSLPSLKERKSDIPLLVHHFITKFNHEKNRKIEGVSKETFDCLTSYSWPGNVRELENLIERLTIIKARGILSFEDLPSKYTKNYAPNKNTLRTTLQFEISEKGIDFNTMVDNYENHLILKALEKTNWNKNQAAKLLRLNRTTLIEKIKKKGLKPPAKKLKDAQA